MKRALISLSDKTGAVQFAKSLFELGFQIISTGGTQKIISEANIPVTNISEITGFPECLDGRVKTLHPNVHAGILAMRNNKEHMEQLEKLQIETIDIVAINLYPFKSTVLKQDVTLEEAIENIDIGGPTMIRAAAKNWQDVAVVVDHNDYNSIIEQLKEGGIKKETKFKLCLKVFEHTAAYDALIAQYLKAQANDEVLPQTLTLTYEKAQEMRYGENPHQQAAFYKEPLEAKIGLANAKQLHGKQLSFNNINDTNSAISLLKEFNNNTPKEASLLEVADNEVDSGYNTFCGIKQRNISTVVAVKHANPCGVGCGKTISEAYKKAYEADSVSIFGGIVALNETVCKETAEEMAKIFLEVIVAPDFTEEAVEILSKKKNIRLLKLEDCLKPIENSNTLDIKKVDGGILVQCSNTKLLDGEIKVVTERAPTHSEMEQLLFAWKVVKHTKSNGIVLAKDNMTVGIGPGQTNRVTALNLAINYAGERAKNSVMASDAFFPFDDCVEAAAKAGITAIIQPGGSINDKDSIAACNKYGIAMIFTGIRHFFH